MADVQQQLQQKPESTANDARSEFERGLEELMLGHYDECMSFTSCSSPRTTVTEDEEGEGEQLVRRRRRSDLDGDDFAESSAARRRHSRILSRWAARQAEMITTIERRNRESELMALAGLQTVSMLDSSFLRESQSPTSRRQGNTERPSSQASSILQMWRELEDEHALNRARERLRQQRSVDSNTNGSANRSESRESENQGSLGDASESENDYATWTRDQLHPQSENRNHDNSSREQSPDLGEVERERVRQIVRGWMESGISDPTANAIQRNDSPRAEWLGETERERVRIVREWMQLTSQQRGSRSGRRDERDNEPARHVNHVHEGSVTDHEEGQPEHIRRDLLRLRGRQALLDLLVRIERERQGELQGLLEHRAVSDFAHRNRIQSLLRGRFLRNERPLEEERPASGAASELNQLRLRHTVSGLREGFRSRLENIVRVQVSSHPETSSNNDDNDSSQTTNQHVDPEQGSDWQGEITEDERAIGQQSAHNVSNEWMHNTTEVTDWNQQENPVFNWPLETVVTEDAEQHHLQVIHDVWRDNSSLEAVENWSEVPSDPPRMRQSVPHR